MSQFFTWGGQSIGVSASASVLPMNFQDWFPSGWTGWTFLLSKGLSRVLQHCSSKASILWWTAFFKVQLSYPYMTTGKTIALTRWTLVGKVMSLLFNVWYIKIRKINNYVLNGDYGFKKCKRLGDYVNSLVKNWKLWNETKNWKYKQSSNLSIFAYTMCI